MINIPEIEGVDFGNVDIHVEGLTEFGVDLGSIQLENNGRRFVLDTTSYYCSLDCDGNGVVNCDIDVDTDTFPVGEYKYDLTKNDLLDMNHGGTGTLYVTTAEGFKPFKVKDIQLWFTANDEYQHISLEEEL